jgi:hypothetical protein
MVNWIVKGDIAINIFDKIKRPPILFWNRCDFYMGYQLFQ